MLLLLIHTAGFLGFTSKFPCLTCKIGMNYVSQLLESQLSLIDSVKKLIWMEDIKISLSLKLILVWKSHRRLRSSSRRRQIMWPTFKFCVAAAIHILFWVWPHLHDVMDQLQQERLHLVQTQAALSCLKLALFAMPLTQSEISWLLLNCCKDFLNWCTHMGALFWNNTSWCLGLCWSVNIIMFGYLKYDLNKI